MLLPTARTERLPRARAISSDAWVLVALTVLGAVLRFSTIATQSYWFDEAQAVHEMHLSFGGMLSS